MKIFSERREKEKEIRKYVIAKTLSEKGLQDIKELFRSTKAEARYMGSGRFSLTVKDRDFKQANNKMAQILKELEDKAKSLHITFTVQ